MKRDKSIDMVRGIGILLVVLGHSGMPHSSVIFRFHMALFFIISGWCFSDRYLQNFKAVLCLIWKKIRGLYLPFILFNGITLILQNVLIDINLYTDNPGFLDEAAFGGNAYGIMNKISPEEILRRIVSGILTFGKGETQFGGATWFLRVLFGVTVMWCISNWILKSVAKFNERWRMYINIVLAFFLMCVSWQWMQTDSHFSMQFETMASAYIMFCVGYYLKRHYPRMEKIQNIVIAFVSILILLYCDHICNLNGWNSNINYFADPFMYMASSLSGYLAVFSIACLVKEIKGFHIVQAAGQHSLSILLFHFLSFKAVTLVQVMLYHEPLYRLASFPVYNSGNCWWVIYALCGVALPLCGAVIWGKIREGMKRKSRKETI